MTQEAFDALKSKYARLGESWTKEETKELEEMWAAGVKIEDMSNQLQRTPNGIRKRLIALGIIIPNPAPKPWTEENDKSLVAAFNEGKGFDEMATTFGRSEKSIIARLVRLRANLFPEQ